MINSQFKKNVVWNVLGSLSGKLLVPLFHILIASMLMPEDYGVFALAMAILLFQAVFKDLGMTEAAIVNNQNMDYVSIQFTVQLFLGLLFYVAVFLAAPFISDFFHQPVLLEVLPIICLIVFINAFVDPYVTKYLKEQNYKLIAFRQFLSPLFTGGVGFLLAWQDFGVMSLVYGYLAGQLIIVYLFYRNERCPKLIFNLSAFYSLFAMGKHILIQRFSGYVANQSDSFVIGAYFGADKLGIYRMASQLVQLLPGSVFFYANQVLFTEFSKRRQLDDDHFIEKAYYKYVNVTGSFLLFYAMGAYFIAPILIPYVLGEQWEGIALIIGVFSAGIATSFMCVPNNDLSKVLGFAHRYSYFSVIRSSVTIISIVLASQLGFLYAVIAWVVVGLLANIVNEILFHVSQDVVKVKMSKYVLYVLTWCWSAFVITESLQEL